MKANQTQKCVHAQATYVRWVFISFDFFQMILLELFTENDWSRPTRTNSIVVERNSDRVIEAFLLPVNDKFPSSQYQKNSRSILISKQPLSRLTRCCLKTTKLSHYSRWPLSQLTNFNITYTVWLVYISNIAFVGALGGLNRSLLVLFAYSF